MLITIISDTHNKHKQIKLPQGDILIHCGDFTGHGYPKEIRRFLDWFRNQPYEYKIFIAGNHDLWLEREEIANELLGKLDSNMFYLNNSSIELNGIKFWGSPWQPEFCNWAFNLPREGNELRQIWNQIPEDTDFLITHTPPKGILDKCDHQHINYPENAGCELLKERIDQLNIKYHCFGHIHERRGTLLDKITYINASICNLSYEPVNAPIYLEYKK